MPSSRPQPVRPPSLTGRDAELEMIAEFLREAAMGGGALLLSGDAGIGKSVLLDAAAARAEAAGFRVLRAAGAQFEADVAFTTLRQLLEPVLGTSAPGGEHSP